MTHSNLDLTQLRETIRRWHLRDEGEALAALYDLAALDTKARLAISKQACAIIDHLRQAGQPGLLETLFGEYDLSNQEGVGLLCLAEAVLRVPDKPTLDELIEDKIVSGDWGGHIGRDHPGLVNISGWALLLGQKILAPDQNRNHNQTQEKNSSPNNLYAILRDLLKRLGEPVIRTAIQQAVKHLAQQFILGSDMEKAMARAAKMEAKGYLYSYDMLGEAALSQAQAKRYFSAYHAAICALSKSRKAKTYQQNPGISVKLSALHPRYETAQRETILPELIERVADLAKLAKSADLGLNIDAEEEERLDISLDIIEALAKRKDLAGWDGLGVVVQSYGKRAPYVIDWLYALAQKTRRRFMLRLVKGAYWDREIKRAQSLGIDGFAVFTRKAASDVSFIACMRKIFALGDRFYPQFATHNAHSLAAILRYAPPGQAFELQRLPRYGRKTTRIYQRSDQYRLPDLCSGRLASRSFVISGAPLVGKWRQ